MNKITKLEKNTVITHDAVGEFTIPDYLPAVGRLLLSSASVSPDGVYLRETGGTVTADLGGEITFRALWLGDGEESAVPVSAAFRCDYESSAAIGGAAAPLCISATSVENVFCRVTGPRKLSLRARLSSRVTAFSASEPKEVSYKNAEVKTGTVNSVITVKGSLRDEFISLPYTKDGDAVYTDGDVRITSCKLTLSGECRCSGEITLTVLFKNDGGITSEALSFPFECDVSLDGEVTENCAFTAYGNISSAEFIPEKGAIEVIYSVSLCGMAATSAKTALDAYVCGSDSVCEYENISYLSRPNVILGSVSVNEKCSANAKGELLFASASASVSEVSSDGAKLRISGSVSGNAVFCDSGEYETVPFSVPWKYEVSEATVGTAYSPEYFATATPTAVTLRTDTGGMTVNTEVTVSAVTSAISSVTSVKALSENGGEVTDTRGVITVSYPSKDETAWDIAKKYKIPKKRAEKDNLNDDGTLKKMIVF